MSIAKHARPLALGALLVAGCATQQDVQDTRRDLQEARQQAADAKSMVESVRQDVNTLRGEIDQLKFQTSGGGNKSEEMARRLDALEARIATMEAGVQAGGMAAAPFGGAAAPGAPAAPAVSGLESEVLPAEAPAEYRDGVDLLRKGDVEPAIQRFREFLRKSPKSDLADNAQYWIGEAYYSNRDFNRAILEFNEVLLRYPKGDKVPAALLRQASAFAELGDKVDARLVLQKLLSEHGSTPEAEQGRQKLAELAS